MVFDSGPPKRSSPSTSLRFISFSPRKGPSGRGLTVTDFRAHGKSLWQPRAISSTKARRRRTIASGVIYTRSMYRFDRALLTLGVAAMALAAQPALPRAQEHPYKVVEGWAQVPADFAWGEIADADVDASGNLWVLHRPPTPGGSAAAAGKTRGGETPVLMFDRSRKLVRSFGKDRFLQPHGLHVDPEGNIWVTDSGPFYAAGQTPGKGFQVFKFTREGKLLMTLGKAGVGVAGSETFVGPTDVVVNEHGEIFVADGHTPRPGIPTGDRIVKLSKDGR